MTSEIRESRRARQSQCAIPPFPSHPASSYSCGSPSTRLRSIFRATLRRDEMVARSDPRASFPLRKISPGRLSWTQPARYSPGTSVVVHLREGSVLHRPSCILFIPRRWSFRKKCDRIDYKLQISRIGTYAFNSEKVCIYAMQKQNLSSRYYIATLLFTANCVSSPPPPPLPFSTLSLY